MGLCTHTTVVHSQKFKAKNCGGCLSCAKFWAKRINTAVIYCTGDILRWMLKLSKSGAYTAQNLAQLGEKNSTSALEVLVAFCISALKCCQYFHSWHRGSLHWNEFSGNKGFQYHPWQEDEEYWMIIADKHCEYISFFIGPRYTWGPIYGSRVSLTD